MWRARLRTCAGTAHEVQSARHTRAPGDVTHKVCVQHLQPLVARPVWYNGFGVSLVCTHLRWVSVVDGLYRRWFGCFVVTGTCCVLHVVFPFRTTTVRTMFFRAPLPGLFTSRRCPRSTVPAPEARIGLFAPRIRVKFVEQDINSQRSEKCAVGRTSVSDRRC